MQNTPNYKSLLNSFCGSHKLTFPRFNHKRVGGVPHDPLWQASTVFEGQDYLSEIFSNKNECENSICKEIYEMLTTLELSKGNMEIEKPQFKPIFDLIRLEDLIKYLLAQREQKGDLKLFLIDIENLSNIESKEIKKYEDTHTVIVVKSLASNNIKLPEDVKIGLFVTQSKLRDAADTAITMLVGALFLYTTDIIIASKDHFCYTIKDILSAEDMNVSVQNKSLTEP